MKQKFEKEAAQFEVQLKARDERVRTLERSEKKVMIDRER